jgi:hypothetical protein
MFRPDALEITGMAAPTCLGQMAGDELEVWGGMVQRLRPKHCAATGEIFDKNRQGQQHIPSDGPGTCSLVWPFCGMQESHVGGAQCGGDSAIPS